MRDREERDTVEKGAHMSFRISISTSVSVSLGFDECHVLKMQGVNGMVGERHCIFKSLEETRNTFGKPILKINFPE